MDIGEVITVDSEDEHLLGEYSWYICRHRDKFYARAHVPGSGRKHKRVYLHRLIMGDPNGKVVDHKNGDTLDNSRRNLRVCSHAQNMQNSKKRAHSKQTYRGIRQVGNSSWQASISHDGHRIYLGVFGTPYDAALAYDEAARRFHGEFAQTNFKKEDK